jgi:cytochrome c oxidase subunit 2
LVIKVTAFQWDFRFEYPNGVTTVGEVYVPANTTVEFNVTSSDVMHNFYLVEFRVSVDAIAGRYNAIWVTTPGLDGNSELTYHIECKELCGIGHTYMRAQMEVISPTAFDQWLSNQTETAQGG